MSSYTVSCWIDGPDWIVYVRELDRSATARRVSQVGAVARGLVASYSDDDPDTAHFEFNLLADTITAALADTRVTDLPGTAAEVEAVTVRNGLAWRLAQQGLNFGNLDTLVGEPAPWLAELAPEARRRRSTVAAPGAPEQRPHEHANYRHEAFLYRGEDEYVSGLVPFIVEGLRLDQPVMVAVPDVRLQLLRSALGSAADRVVMADMTELGHNPARIIPAWSRFIEQHQGSGRPLRGIGEPIWAGRRTLELLECQLHEALLNVAVDPATPLWLRCPYDVSNLPEDVVEEATRSHPEVSRPGAEQPNRAYGGEGHIQGIFGTDLDEPRVAPDQLTFNVETLATVRQFVIRRALAAGMHPTRTADVALAVWEVARDSAVNVGGPCVLRVWTQDRTFVCEVADDRRTSDVLVGRVPPRLAPVEGRDGAWLANQLCDLVQIRSPERGSVFRIVSWI